MLTSEDDESVEESEEIVLTSDEEEESEPEYVEPEPAPEEPAPVESASAGPTPAEPVPAHSANAPIPHTITREEYERIREEVRKEVYEEAYGLGVMDAVAKLAETAKADETADAVAAESKPLGRKTRTPKQKAEKPAKGRRILRSKEGSQ